MINPVYNVPRSYADQEEYARKVSREIEIKLGSSFFDKFTVVYMGNLNWFISPQLPDCRLSGEF